MKHFRLLEEGEIIRDGDFFTLDPNPNPQLARGWMAILSYYSCLNKPWISTYFKIKREIVKNHPADVF